MKWHTQADSITTNLNVKIYCTLPELSATKIMVCNCHMNDYAKGRYDMTLGRYLLKALGLNLKLSVITRRYPCKIGRASCYD